MQHINADQISGVSARINAAFIPNDAIFSKKNARETNAAAVIG